MSLTQATSSFEVLLSESNPLVSRAAATVASGSDNADLVAGTVMGKVIAGTVPSTGTAYSGNTTGDVVKTVTGGLLTQVGVYTIKCRALADLGGASGQSPGIWAVTDPEGYEVGTVIQGKAFTHPELNFTLTASGTAAAVDDYFTITVPAGSGYWSIYDPAAVNGMLNDVGVLLQATDAELAIKLGTVVRAQAVVKSSFLAWKAGATTAQKARALAWAAKKNLISL